MPRLSASQSFLNKVDALWPQLVEACSMAKKCNEEAFRRQHALLAATLYDLPPTPNKSQELALSEAALYTDLKSATAIVSFWSWKTRYRERCGNKRQLSPLPANSPELFVYLYAREIACRLHGQTVTRAANELVCLRNEAADLSSRLHVQLAQLHLEFTLSQRTFNRFDPDYYYGDPFWPLTNDMQECVMDLEVPNSNNAPNIFYSMVQAAKAEEILSKPEFVDQAWRLTTVAVEMWTDYIKSNDAFSVEQTPVVFRCLEPNAKKRPDAPWYVAKRWNIHETSDGWNRESTVLNAAGKEKIRSILQEAMQHARKPMEQLCFPMDMPLLEAWEHIRAIYEGGRQNPGQVKGARLQDAVWFTQAMRLMHYDWDGQLPTPQESEWIYPFARNNTYRYEDLGPYNLGAYLKWRTQWRRGERPPTTNLCIRLYAQEIANRIRGESITQAADALLQLLEDFRIRNDNSPRAMYGFLSQIILDYIVWYQLPFSYLQRLAKLGPIDVDPAYWEPRLWPLINPFVYDDKTVADTICQTLQMQQEASEPTKALMVNAWRIMKREALYPKKGLTGSFHHRPWDLFCSFVFLRGCHADTTYPYFSSHIFCCQRNEWTCSIFHCDQQKLRNLLADLWWGAAQRCNEHWAPQEKIKISRKVQNALEAAYAELAYGVKSAIQTVHINRDNLKAIRENALQIQEKLVTDEEKPSKPAQKHKLAMPVTASQQASQTTSPMEHFNSLQRAFLTALLTNNTHQAKTLVEGQALSVFVDQLNTKLLDLLGDSAVEMVGDEPRIVTDYREDVLVLLKQRNVK